MKWEFVGWGTGREEIDWRRRNIPFVAILYEGRRRQAATCRMQFKKGVVRVSFMRIGTRSHEKYLICLAVGGMSAQKWIERECRVQSRDILNDHVHALSVERD